MYSYILKISPNTEFVTIKCKKKSFWKLKPCEITDLEFRGRVKLGKRVWNMCERSIERSKRKIFVILKVSYLKFLFGKSHFLMLLQINNDFYWVFLVMVNFALYIFSLIIYLVNFYLLQIFKIKTHCLFTGFFFSQFLWDILSYLFCKVNLKLHHYIPENHLTSA